MFSFLTSCDKSNNCITGTGTYISRDYNINSFDRLEISGIADVYISNDSTSYLRIEGQENILDILTVENRNKSLIIGGNHCFKDIKTLQIYVSGSMLNTLYTSGKCNSYLMDTVSTNVFTANISGTGHMELKLNVDEFNSSISGDAEIKAVGKAIDQNYNISGIGKYYNYDLLGENASVDISGTGNLELNVSTKLIIEISGLGDINYKGNPSIEKDISGEATINHVN